MENATAGANGREKEKIHKARTKRLDDMGQREGIQLSFLGADNVRGNS